MDLKKTILVLAAAALALSACSGTGKDIAALGGADAAAFATGGEVTKTLKVKDFSRIKSSLYVDIHYTQGAQYKVTVSGTAGAIAKADFSVSDGTLTIKQKSDNSTVNNGNESNHLWLDITAPDLNGIDNNGRMSLQAKTFSPSEFVIDNSGILNISTESIKCKATGDGFSLDNSGRMELNSSAITAANASISNNGILTFNGGKMEIEATHMDNSGRIDISGNVKGASASISNNGIFTSGMTFDLAKEYKYDNSGRYDFTGNITAGSIDISNAGIDSQKTELKADALKIGINGRSDYDMGFSGSEAQLECSGIGTFNLDVDCQKLNVEASGRIEVTLSGTADNTEFTGSGISNIDTTGLNKF